MAPPIFSICAADPAVTALLGQMPTRLFKFGHAPQNVQYPYAVWRTVGGSPENYLGNRPDCDTYTLQVEVYATQSQGTEMAEQIAAALRDAIEPHAHIVSWLGDDVDPETKNYVVRFRVDWIVHR